MYEFINILINPLVIFWLLTAVSGIAYFVNRRKLAKISLCSAMAWLFVISISPVPQWLVRELEKCYPIVDLNKLVDGESIHIVVLGGGHVNASDLPPTNQLSDQALERLGEAIRIHKKKPSSKLVFSGYSRSGRMPHARVLALAALDLGIKPEDTLMVTTPGNTAQEAAHYRKKFGAVHDVVLVTNAIHMKRAMKYFEREGLRVTAAPTNHFIKIDSLTSMYDFIPYDGKITMMSKALHEYVGLIQFQLSSGN